MCASLLFMASYYFFFTSYNRKGGYVCIVQVYKWQVQVKDVKCVIWPWLTSVSCFNHLDWDISQRM